MQAKRETLDHPFPPLYDAHSRVLILGSFPSVKSRQMLFFYGNPRNRFWQVLAAVLGSPLPESIEEKRSFLLSQRIALWDSIAHCTLVGSSDASISDVQPNDIGRILAGSSIRQIFCNGQKSWQVYQHYVQPQTKREAIALPSTSPANAAWNLERLISAWQVVGQAARQEELW